MGLYILVRRSYRTAQDGAALAEETQISLLVLVLVKRSNTPILLAPEGFNSKLELLPEPQGTIQMVRRRSARAGMDEDIQPLTVEHQPWDDPAELFRREGDLVHGLWVGTDRLVMPAAELNAKSGAEPFPHARSYLTGRGIVVNMGMKALDLGIFFFHLYHLTHPHPALSLEGRG